MTRIELVTSSLPRKRSTSELHRLLNHLDTLSSFYFNLSGKRGSNPQHSAWKADTLPIELFPHNKGGRSRIRTCEGKNQQIYSLSSLAA